VALHFVAAPCDATTQAETAPVVAGVGAEVGVVDLRPGATLLLLHVGAASAGQYADLPAAELAVDADQHAVAVGVGARGVGIAIELAVAAAGLHPCTGGVARLRTGCRRAGAARQRGITDVAAAFDQGQRRGSVQFATDAVEHAADLLREQLGERLGQAL